MNDPCDQVSCCDVCGREGPTSVHASSLGPASMAFCGACLERKAEPLMMVATAIFFAKRHNDGDLSQLANVVSFVDGAYVDLDRVLKHCDELEVIVREEFFGPDD